MTELRISICSRPPGPRAIKGTGGGEGQTQLALPDVLVHDSSAARKGQRYDGKHASGAKKQGDMKFDEIVMRKLFHRKHERNNQVPDLCYK